MKSKITQIKNPLLGMNEWKYKSCTAEICTGDDWATIYSIYSTDKLKGHAQSLLKEAKEYYESKGYEFGGTVALNEIMKHIYKKLNITEYK